MSGAFPPPPIGSRVRIVKSENTTNWTRIDIGRVGVVTGYLVFSLSSFAGPRLNLLVVPETVERWDSRPGLPLHLHPTQVERLVAHAGIT